MTDLNTSSLFHTLEIGDPKTIEMIKENNHVYKIAAERETYFLKVYTKDWYSQNPKETSEPTKHEYYSSLILKNNNINTVDIISHSLNAENILERPYILTKSLEGENLLTNLKKVNTSEYQSILIRVGEYLHNVNQIKLKLAGYIDSENGPTVLPTYNGWRHRMWTAEARQTDSLKMLENLKDSISVSLYNEMESRFQTITTKLADAYTHPSFIFGDCHVQHFFVNKRGNDWSVSGVIDMEVTSGGDKIEDVLKFSIEMAREILPGIQWWIPFFQGYKEEPDFELFKLRLLGASMRELKWGKDPEQVYRHILNANNWKDLFNITKLKESNE